MKTKLIALITIALGTLLLNACNTVHGFGQDVQQGGQDIKQASDENR